MRIKRNKIINYFLLLSFLAITFPISELLHKHESNIVNCFDTDDHEEDDHHSEKFHKKCSHETHFSKAKEKHICFYTYLNSPFTVFTFDTIFFRSVSFDSFLPQNIEKCYLKTFLSYLLRGPPVHYPSI